MDMSQSSPILADGKTDVESREPRVSQLVSIGLSSAKHKNVRVVVRNLSPHGIGARGDVELSLCERITVHFSDGRDVGGIVRWLRKNTFGLLLDEEIDPTILQPRAPAVGAIVPRDANLGFQRMRHQPSAGRTGFQRTHRDPAFCTSNWTQG